MKKARDYAVGVDIGGTFTDLVLLDRSSGRLAAGKVLTDYENLADAVLKGLDALLESQGVKGSEVRSVVHGTTLVTNALIERRGSPTALIVTRGFSDVLEFGRESRFNIFQIDIELPAPLIPRRHVFEITERLDHAGRIVEPLAEDEVRALAADLLRSGIRAVGVCLLHSYRNGDHEREIGRIFAEEAPEIAVSLSSEVMPDIREYERANTVVANAYVQPTIRDYVERLEGMLQSLKIKAPLLLMTSDGGTISTKAAVTHPIRLVESGPAGGAIAASYLGRDSKLDKIIAYDMGGTTAKICLIDDGRPERADQLEFGRVYRFARGSGLPLQVPAVDMIEIGAGGGSIAHLDDVGRLRVGPESSGAAPGPACYSLGGTSPTVTDADLYLGYLSADSFLGGKMQLSRAAAAASLDELAKVLGLTTTRTAWGVHEVVNDNMARAAKIHCLERGKDPRDYTLVAYGGAGPVHAYGIAQTLGIRTIVYPLRAGVMSAFGFLVAPPAFESVRALPSPLATLDLGRANAMFKEMEQEGRRLVKTAGVPATQCVVRREFSVSFLGQNAKLLIRLPEHRLAAADLEDVRTAFLEQYRARYHRLNPAVPLEVVNLRVVVSAPERRIKLTHRSGKQPATAKKGMREIYIPSRDAFVRCAVYDRYALKPGARLRGPAIIEEVESTVLLGPDAVATVAPNGNLVVKR